MKIEVNGPCPCGSGKKYKHCCMRKAKMTEYDRIKDIVQTSGYDEKVGQFLCSLYRNMRDRNWTGACHATCSILYVGLSEMGYAPTIYMGELHEPLFVWASCTNPFLYGRVARALFIVCMHYCCHHSCPN